MGGGAGDAAFGQRDDTRELGAKAGSMNLSVT